MYFGGGFAKSKKTGKNFNERIYLNLFLKNFDFFFLILAVFSLKKDRVSVPLGIYEFNFIKYRTIA